MFGFFLKKAQQNNLNERENYDFIPDIFAFCLILASSWIVGSLQVPLFTNGQVKGPGPGFFPLIFSLHYFVYKCFLLFLWDKSDKKFNFRVSLITG